MSIHINHILIALAGAFAASFASCMEWDYGNSAEPFDAAANGLFICCEGNFQYGNASLSYYNPMSGVAENEVFLRANGMKLGDVAQSMTRHGDRGWIVVNNSHVVFAIDLNTFKETSRIENLTSPRYIHFISDDKAYITQLWDNRIAIVNPTRGEITGHITVPGMTAGNGSTEQMVSWGKYVLCNCWSYNDRIIKIDTERDEVVDELTTEWQPSSIALDCHGRLWVVTDGHVKGNTPTLPTLYRIDAETLQVEHTFRLPKRETAGKLSMNGACDTLYWINDDVWRMDVTADALPPAPFIASHGTRYYGLTVDPSNSEVYIADAIDYQQQGIVYRYTSDGILVDEFYTGVTPGAFCWK